MKKRNILFKKSNEYAVTSLAINQNTDNLIEVSDKNRKRIKQELIENLLKQEKEDEDAYSLKIHNSEGYAEVIPLTKKTPTELPSLKFNRRKKNRRNKLLRPLRSSGKIWI